MISTIQAGEWIRWVEANWVGLFAMLSVAGMAAVFIFLGLAPVEASEPPIPEEPRDSASGEGSVEPRPESRSPGGR